MVIKFYQLKSCSFKAILNIKNFKKASPEDVVNFQAFPLNIQIEKSVFCSLFKLKMREEMEFRLQWKPAVCEENVLIFIMVLWTCQVVIRVFSEQLSQGDFAGLCGGIMKTVILWTVSRTTSNTCFWIRNKLKTR